MGEDEAVARLAFEMHHARRLRRKRRLPVPGEGAHMAAGIHGEIAGVAAFHIGQQVERLDRDGAAGLGHPHLALALAAIGVGEALEPVARGAHDRLRHAEGEVRAHDIDDEVEHRRMVDEVDEGLVVGEQVAPVHEGFRVLVRALLDPAVMAPRQHARQRLVARALADLVDPVREQGHLVGRQRSFDQQVAVDIPVASLFGRQCLHRV